MTGVLAVLFVFVSPSHRRAKVSHSKLRPPAPLIYEANMPGTPRSRLFGRLEASFGHIVLVFVYWREAASQKRYNG